MFSKNLTFIGAFESNFKDVSYNIYKFADPLSYRILYFSTEKKYNLEVGLVYNCLIEVKNNKFKITNVK